MDELTSTEGIVALAAAGVGLVALLFALVVGFKLRRLRKAQSAVLGDTDQRDLVSHAARLEQGFTDLREWVEESMTRLDERMGTLERRVDGCVAYSGLVRYDAWGEMSGRQSTSVALLDTHRSGVVISSIAHRDTARIYVKQVSAGESEIELSPEEQEAMDTALSSGPREAAAQPN
jgi:Protein of unknown function (DUF4446)